MADGAGGIEAALAEIYPWVPIQRCGWHQVQRLRAHASNPRVARTMMEEAARCYRSADARTVQRNLQAFLDCWRTAEPVAIRALAAELEGTLSYLQLPPPWDRCFRTTNCLQRLFRALRQRTKRIGSFGPPVHLGPMLLGIVMQSPWVQLPIPFQPLLTQTQLFERYRKCFGSLPREDHRFGWAFCIGTAQLTLGVENNPWCQGLARP